MGVVMNQSPSLSEDNQAQGDLNISKKDVYDMSQSGSVIVHKLSPLLNIYSVSFIY